MKKLIPIIAAIIVSATLFTFGGFMWGYQLADYKAFNSVCNSEQTDILELTIEYDKHAEIVSTYYDYENGTGYLVLKDEENIYTINVKVKKVAPFRYEWVEVVFYE